MALTFLQLLRTCHWYDTTELHLCVSVRKQPFEILCCKSTCKEAAAAAEVVY